MFEEQTEGARLIEWLVVVDELWLFLLLEQPLEAALGSSGNRFGFILKSLGSRQGYHFSLVDQAQLLALDIQIGEHLLHQGEDALNQGLEVSLRILRMLQDGDSCFDLGVELAGARDFLRGNHRHDGRKLRLQF